MPKQTNMNQNHADFPHDSSTAMTKSAKGSSYMHYLSDSEEDLLTITASSMSISSSSSQPVKEKTKSTDQHRPCHQLKVLDERTGQVYEIPIHNDHAAKGM